MGRNKQLFFPLDAGKAPQSGELVGQDGRRLMLGLVQLQLQLQNSNGPNAQSVSAALLQVNCTCGPPPCALLENRSCPAQLLNCWSLEPTHMDSL